MQARKRRTGAYGDVSTTPPSLSAPDYLDRQPRAARGRRSSREFAEPQLRRVKRDSDAPDDADAVDRRGYRRSVLPMSERRYFVYVCGRMDNGIFAAIANFAHGLHRWCPERLIHG